MISTARFFASLCPVTILLGALILSVILACLSSVTALLCGLMGALALFWLAPVPHAPALRKLAAVNLFMALIWLTAPWTTPGETLWQWKFLSISREGLHLALLTTLKANSIVLVFLALLAYMPLLQLAESLLAIGMPNKLAFLLLSLNSNIHLLRRQYVALLEAARLRGFRSGFNLHSYRVISALLALLVIRASERGQRLQEALKLKGFNGRLPLRPHWRFHFSDACFTVCVFFLCSILLLAEFGKLHV